MNQDSHGPERQQDLRARASWRLVAGSDLFADTRNIGSFGDLAAIVTRAGTAGAEMTSAASLRPPRSLSWASLCLHSRTARMLPW